MTSQTKQYEVDPSGFEGDYEIIQHGQSFVAKPFDSPKEFEFEADTTYHLGTRTNVPGGYMTFETDSEGNIITDSIIPEGCVSIVDDSKLVFTTLDLVIQRGNYRGELATDLKPKGVSLSFATDESFTLKAIQGIMFSCDTTAQVGCSTFRGTVTQQNSVDMSLAKNSVTIQGNEIKLNSVNLTFSPVGGEKLTISGQEEPVTASQTFSLIKSVCVRVTYFDDENNKIGTIDLTPGE